MDVSPLIGLSERNQVITLLKDITEMLVRVSSVYKDVDQQSLVSPKHKKGKYHPLKL